MPGAKKDAKAPPRNATRVADVLDQMESRRRKGRATAPRRRDDLDLDSIR